MKKLWIGLIIVSFLDILTTKLFLSRGFIEANPLAEFLFKQTNFLFAAFLLKTILLSMIYAIRGYRYIGLVLKTVIVISTLACINNFMVYFLL